jgi:hypothetical protein
VFVVSLTNLSQQYHHFRNHSSVFFYKQDANVNSRAHFKTFSSLMLNNFVGVSRPYFDLLASVCSLSVDDLSGSVLFLSQPISGRSNVTTVSCFFIAANSQMINCHCIF